MKENSREKPIYTGKENIIEMNIFELAKEIMQIHGANINIARMISNMYDGLKPVEKRVLWTMFKNCKLTNKTLKTKVSNVTGQAMADYYPHGDMSLTGTIVRMGQWWSNILPYIDKQGNYGTIMGDPHAAARYIEARMSDYTYDCFFSEWVDNIVDMVPSYDDRNLEPENLPAKYPNILINGSFGLGFSISAGIPTHNFNEVIDLTVKLLDNPNYDKCILYPDSPTGCDILNTDFADICKTGEGKFRMRANITITENDNLLITTIPFSTNSNDIIAKITELVKEKHKLESIKDIKDDSDGSGIHMLVELKKGFDPYTVRDELYKSTALEDTCSVVYGVVYDNRTHTYSLKRLILDWIEFRRETKRRILAFNIAKAKRRMHTIEALMEIMLKDKGLDRVITLIKKSKNRSSAIEELINAFKITDLQAESIADMALYQLSRESSVGLSDEYDKLTSKMTDLQKLFKSTKEIDKVIRQELLDGKKKYGRPRMSQIVELGEKVIPDTDHTIIFTKKGTVKKLPEDFNGVGRLDKDDYVIETIHANNRSCLLLFDRDGRVFTVPVYQLRDNEQEKLGTNITNYVPTNQIVTVMDRMSDDDMAQEIEPLYLVFATKFGVVKKTLLKNYSNVYGSGLIGIKLKPEDKLVSAKLIKGDEDIILYTKFGKGIRFNTEEIPETLRMTMGVRGLKLKDDDFVVGMSIVDIDTKFVFVLSAGGMGKKCLLSSFDTSTRGDNGMNLLLLEDDDELIHAKAVKPNDIISVYTENKIEDINMKNVMELTRMSKGKKVLALRKSEKIIDILH